MKRKLGYILTAAITAGCIFQSAGMVCAEEAAEKTEVTEEVETTETEEDPADLENTIGDAFSEEEMPPFIVEMLNPTLPEIKEGVTHIACVGDSITWGAGVMIPDMDFDSTYPAFLEEELGDGYQTINYGLGGKTLLNEGDDPYTGHEFYTLSQDLQADIYIIMLGTNDSKPYNWDADLFKTELESFVKTYQDLPNDPEIYLATPPRAFVVEGAEEEGYDIKNDTIRDEIAPIVREIAETAGVTLIDMYAETENHPEWFPDGVHPDAAGNREFAKIVASYLGK